MGATVLLCTVGGSHAPILTALRETQADYVCFFCTGDDPVNGAPGSRSQIEGEGRPVVRRRPDGSVENLPNIPTQAGLIDGSFEVREVPADDLDRAVCTMLDAIADLGQKFPDAAMTADYTGGTKTMTAALVIAALETERVALRLVTGPRRDLVTVRDGSQSSFEVRVEGIRLRRSMAPLLGAWRRFAYGEAADGLAALPTPKAPDLREELDIARDLSRAFDAWDRFDHAAALAACDPHRERLSLTMAGSLAFLDTLASSGAAAGEPARLWDLWLNALRRGTQRRYDDAVARLYRLIEWTAQWVLAGKGIDTSDLRPEQLAPGMVLVTGRDGKHQVGLYAAWELVLHHVGGPAGAFALRERGRVLEHTLVRNGSILAHGGTPVNQRAWEAFSGWVAEALLPVLREEGAKSGLPREPVQLPSSPPWRMATF